MSYYSKSYRKFLATAVSVAVAVSLVVSPLPSDAATKTFPDVKQDFWAAKEIYSLVEKGIINGFEDNTYKPNQSIIRGHVAHLLTDALELPVPSNLKSFEDVSEKSFYAKGAAATKAAGIFEGYANKFDPTGVLTREQMASVIVRAFGLEGIANAPEVKFKDFAQVSKVHQEDVKILAQNGIIIGNPDGTFAPKAPVNRAAFAVVMVRALQADDTYTLSIMHTNDTHANTDKVAKRATAIKEVRAEKPNALLIDAGDVMSGTLYFNEFKGQADLEFMNAIGYDVMTFGNHEFDLGSTADGHKALSEFVKAAKFPFVSTNVDFSKDTLFNGIYKGGIYSNTPEDGNIYSGIIKEVEGEKVGFFGLTTVETPSISSPGSVEFKDYLAKAEEAVDAFEKAGVDKIVAISHLGYDDNPAIDNDLELAKRVDGIDLIVGGHSHTQLDKPVLVDEDEKGVEKEPTVIVQAYQYNDFLGTIDVDFDENGVVTGYAGKLIKTADKAEDAETAAALKKYSDKIASVKNTETGATAVNELPNPRLGNGSTISVRSNETALGNLITDGMLDKAKEFNSNTVIAVQNGGGIRAAIDQGPITLGDILTTLSFGNTLATMKLTGAEIIKALEHSVSQAPKENGGFLQVAGMKFTYDSSKAVGSRVVSVDVKEQDGVVKPLDPAKEYVVATNAFTAKGGDGFTVFADVYKAGRVTDLGFADWENLRDYVTKLGNVDPTIEGRIVDEAAK